MIGISEQKYEIAYVWVYDPDVEFICDADEDPNERMFEYFQIRVM